MYDSKARNGVYGRAAARPRLYSDHFRKSETSESEVRPSEADLLRAIGRMLAEQRAEEERIRAEHMAPLVDRIETILGARLQAANDAGARHLPVPDYDEPQYRQPAIEEDADRTVAHELPFAEEPAPSFGFGWIRGAVIVLAGTILGAGMPMLMPASPLRYSAETMLAVQADNASRAVSTDAAAKRLLSAPLIAATVVSLKLDRDAEFAGSSSNALGVAFDLLSGNGAAADPASRAEAALRKSVEVTADVRSGTISLKVSTSDSAKSVRIANSLAGTIADAGAASAKPAETDAALRKTYEDAQTELAAFAARNGDGNVKVAGDLQRQIDQLDADLKGADQNILTAKETADRLKAAKLADVMSGALPPDMMSPALQDWRDKYATAKAAIAQLSAELGPRHPRLLQQQAEADGLKDSMNRELIRLAQNAAANARSAVAARKDLSDRRNRLIAQSRDTGVDLARLTELREKAAAARSRFEEAEATLQAPAGSRISIRRPAQPVTAASAEGPITRSLIGSGIGLAIGFGAMLLLQRRRPHVASEPEVPVIMPQPQPILEYQTEPHRDIEELRGKIAAMRDRFRQYAADRPLVSRN